MVRRTRPLLLAVACCVALTACPTVTSVNGTWKKRSPWIDVDVSVGDELRPGERIYSESSHRSITIKYDNGCERTYQAHSVVIEKEPSCDEEEEEQDEDHDFDEEQDDDGDDDADGDQDADQEQRGEGDQQAQQEPGSQQSPGSTDGMTSQPQVDAVGLPEGPLYTNPGVLATGGWVLGTVTVVAIVAETTKGDSDPAPLSP